MILPDDGLLPFSGLLPGAEGIAGSGPGPTVTLAGTSAGHSTTTGTLTQTGGMAGTSTGTSTTAGALSVARPLTGTSAGTSTSTATLTPLRGLAGVSAGLSDTTGTVSITRGLAAVDHATSTTAITGDLVMQYALAGISRGRGSTRGAMSVSSVRELFYQGRNARIAKRVELERALQAASPGPYMELQANHQALINAALQAQQPPEEDFEDSKVVVNHNIY